jgi:transposase
MMPLTFDGLKKQRFRWALGGVQILRLHWRELVPLAGHRLRLSTAQRINYLLGSIQWFGDVLMTTFTVILMLTAVGIAVNHRLPVRQLTGAAIAVPAVFLLTGLLRALVALRATTRCSWGDALRALRVWFALSWTVTLACIRGLVRSQMAFLRTPKRAEGETGILQALNQARGETLMAVGSVVAAVAMLIHSFAWTTGALAVLLVFQGWVYANAAWAALASEGIKLTPERRAYLRSPQSSGDWPARGGSQRLAMGLGVAAAVGLLIYPLTMSGPPAQPFTSPGGPKIQQLRPPGTGAAPAQTPGRGGGSPATVTTPTPSAPSSPVATPRASPS